MKNRHLLFIVFLIVAQFMTAQTSDVKLAFDLSVIKNEYNGDYGNGIFNFKQQLYPSGGLSLGYYLNPSFNLGLRSSFGDYGYYEDNVNYFRGRKFDMSLYTQYKFNNGYILKESAKFYPFFSVGLGLATYSVNSSIDKSGSEPGIDPTIITKGMDLILPVGVGLKYQISDRFAVQYQYLYSFTNRDNHDENRGPQFFGSTGHPSSKAGNDTYGQQIFSFVFTIGKLKDTDKDGVSDKYDKCPDTPIDVDVDKKGCPIDTDGDGVADYLDQCPDTPSGVQVDIKGCPVDTDGDGVADYLDKCPNTPAGIQVDATGCSIDSDGDGVPDSLDKCPNTQVGVQVDASGCPLDSDGDGVPDNLDKCNNTPVGVKVDIHGCPLDSDGDGISDYLDKCPDVPGIAANKGCPEVKIEVIKIFNQALQGIQFETGKDIIKKTSFPILNKVVTVMKENPSYGLEINGHTDSQGSDATNLLLSQKRADAVKEYLVSKGVDSTRLVTKGHGESTPIADNATATGRSKNRRVEFKIYF